MLVFFNELSFNIISISVFADHSVVEQETFANKAPDGLSSVGILL